MTKRDVAILQDMQTLTSPDLLYSGVVAPNAKEICCKLIAHARNTWINTLLKQHMAILMTLMILTERILVSASLIFLLKALRRSLNLILNPMRSSNRSRLKQLVHQFFNLDPSIPRQVVHLAGYTVFLKVLSSSCLRIFALPSNELQKIKTRHCFDFSDLLDSCFRHRWNSAKHKYAFEITQ